MLTGNKNLVENMRKEEKTLVTMVQVQRNSIEIYVFNELFNKFLVFIFINAVLFKFFVVGCRGWVLQTEYYK